MLRVGILVDTGMTLVELHPMGLAIPVDLNIQAGTQRVDHGRTDTVQTTCSVV